MILPGNNPYGHFDYIFLGAGCASLSLLVRMIDSGKFINKNILLIDKNPKNTNDRTWCFWEKEQGYFENLIYKTWDDLSFISDKEHLKLDIHPYTYKMIRGIDFYKYCFNKIEAQKNISVYYGSVKFLAGGKYITLNEKPLQISNAVVFNSIPTIQPNPAYHQLLQHFKGWVINAPAAFNKNKAILMDFSVSQSKGTTFVYVLPFSASQALIEYTLFSDCLLNDEDYDKALKQYIEGNLNIKDYQIIESEFGVIPMTNQPFPFYAGGIYNIGTAGGNTKSSTGYTFRFIQYQSAQILMDIIDSGKPSIPASFKKFKFYDSTFLNVLATGKLAGKKVFTTLFKKNKASNIFKFLDNESTLSEDISIIKSLPAKQFLVAGLQEIFK